MATRAAKLGRERQRQAAAAAAAAKPIPPELLAEVQRVLAIFEGFYDLVPDEDALAIDPNDFDVDPSPFYEALKSAFALEPAPPDAAFDGLGGTRDRAIHAIAARWRRP